jgi:acyl carrier protein
METDTNFEAVFQELVSRLAGHLDIPERDLSPELEIPTLQLDSVIAVTVLGELQDLYRVDLPVNLFWEKETIGEVAREISQLANSERR